MANKRGIADIAGEVPSKKYPGILERPGGLFRQPFVWVKNGVEKRANRYFVEVSCSVCRKVHLSERNNANRQKEFFCCADCRRVGRSKPDGATKRKRGSNKGDDHVLVKAANHPAARKGFVPEHRVVMERVIGRSLNDRERVHHINLVKSDNHPENLVLCRDDREHFLAHGTLNGCVAKLLEMGVLQFDRRAMKYFVVKDDGRAEAVLIAKFG